MRLILSEAADADIDGISEYTIKTWGEAQADIYVGGLIEALDGIAANPTIGHRAEETPKRYRRLRYGSHLIYFKVTDTTVLIVRVLHAQMDPKRHLR